MVLQPETVRNSPLAGIAEYLAAGSHSRESTAVRKDGRQIITAVSSSHLVLQGQPLYVGFIRDITERKRAEAELRESQEQMLVAREIQQRLFPAKAPAIPGFDIAGMSHPAAAAGGDYFDYLTMLKGRFGVVVGDVTGHGIGPALLMAETRAYLRLLAIRREEVTEILSITNTVILEDVGPGRYVTLFLARIDPATRQLTYGSAGHPPCFLYNERGEIKQVMKRTGKGLGIQQYASFGVTDSVQLEPGDLLLLLTDGVDEAMSENEEFFGLDRLHEFIREHIQESARDIVEGLYAKIRAFCAGAEQADDITAVVVKVK
jgi:serine phosphatase RsbU (regulator of sigma subunit)